MDEVKSNILFEIEIYSNAEEISDIAYRLILEGEV